MSPSLFRALFLTFLSSFFMLSTSAQDSIKVKDIKRIIKTNLPQFINGRYELSVELLITKHASIQLSGGPIRKKIIGNSNGNPYSLHRSGFNYSPQFRIYASKIAPRGFYLSPFLSVDFVTVEFIDNSVNNIAAPVLNLSHSRDETTIRGGILIGKQFIKRKGFTLDFFIGPQFKDETTLTNYNIDKLNNVLSGDNTITQGESLFKTNFPKLDFEKTKTEIGLRYGLNIGFTF